MIVAGVMSGTSLDGIDVAVVELPRLKMRAFRSTPYPVEIRERLLAVSNTECHTADIARLHFELGELYAEAVQQAAVGEAIELVGCHGQTIFHDSGVASLQIGDGSVLAARLGVPVVSDFRPADIAAGGKGAPLIPFFDYKTFAHPQRGRVILNIGGIANLTAIPPKAKPSDVIAFDTGPGNMVIDALAGIATQGQVTFDENGEMAALGEFNAKLFDVLMRDPFRATAPPKSAGREQYGEAFVRLLAQTKLPVYDLMATATAFTAACVASAIHDFVAPRMPVHDLIVSGGGVHNPRIMAQLAAFLPEVRITTSAEFGVDPDAKEAIAFALLAFETWNKRPSNLPSATGASKPAILGKLCRP
jgi:anhydro-N-acetylmuramic acid kinase